MKIYTYPQNFEGFSQDISGCLSLIQYVGSGGCNNIKGIFSILNLLNAPFSYNSLLPSCLMNTVKFMIR